MTSKVEIDKLSRNIDLKSHNYEIVEIVKKSIVTTIVISTVIILTFYIINLTQISILI